MAVTGVADPDRLLRNDAGRAGLPLSLTKPLGVGVLNSRHKATGEVFPQAVDDDDRRSTATRRAAALAAGVALRHRRHRLRAARPPVQAGPRQRRHRGDRRRGGALPRRRARGAARRLRQRRHPAQPGLGAPAPAASAVDEDELLLLADAQTSGGLLVAGEMPGAPVIGELVPAVNGGHRLGALTFLRTWPVRDGDLHVVPGPLRVPIVGKCGRARGRPGLS